MRRLLLGAAIVLSLVVVVFVGVAWPEEAAAVFAGAALVAASVAVWYARPGYKEWLGQQKTPAVELKLSIARSNQGEMEEVTGRRDVEWSHQFVALRVEVVNAGPATVRWGILNVAVPVESTIKMEPHHDAFHVSRWPHPNDEIVAGKTVSVRLGYVERDFPPGHHYRYDAALTLREGECPVLAVLEGHPLVRAKAECTLHVTTKA